MPLRSFAVIMMFSSVIFGIAGSFRLEPDSPPGGSGSQADLKLEKFLPHG